MVVEAVGLAPRSASRIPVAQDSPPEILCSVSLVTQVISFLLTHDHDAEAIRDRAIALGLLRLSDGQIRTSLTIQTASRLLLAGYGLPAQFEIGTPHRVCELLKQGWLLLVLLSDLETNGSRPTATSWYQIRSLSPDGSAPCCLRTRIGVAAAAVETCELTEFLPAWADAGHLLVAAARGWEELPALGTTFFGGSLGPDGVYHWESAECDTDRQGCILRY